MLPRIVFERPRFSKWGVRVSMSILLAALLWSLLSDAELFSRVLLGFFALIASPFLLLVWFRVSQRIELDADGVTVVGRLGSRRGTWADVAAKRGPAFPSSYNWNGSEIGTPPAVAEAEPLFVLRVPEDDAKSGTPLQAAAFVRDRAAGRWLFRLLDAIVELRTSDPQGDWIRQLATIFAARDAVGGGPARAAALPEARTVAPGDAGELDRGRSLPPDRGVVRSRIS